MNLNIPHTVNSIKITQYFANFFVKETRKNSNRFPSDDIEANSLIYNYNPVYTGKNHSTYEQIYVFSKDNFRSNQLL